MTLRQVVPAIALIAAVAFLGVLAQHEASADVGNHGVKFNTVGGPKKVQPNTTEVYGIEVSNVDADGADNISVQLAVTVNNGNCAAPTIDGQAVSSLVKTVTAVPATDKYLMTFSVGYGACSDGGAGSDPDYWLTGDACHPGDPAPAGFGGGACPGTAADNTPDSDPLNDAPVARPVNEH